MEMINNAAYISTTNNMQTEDNIVYEGQARTQVPMEDSVVYDHNGDQIPTKDNTAYVSTHLSNPNCN